MNAEGPAQVELLGHDGADRQAHVAMDKAGEIDAIWARWIGPNTEFKLVREEKVTPLANLKFELLS